MTEYISHGVNLTAGQAEKIYNARKNNEGVTIRLSKSDLYGEFNLPLTKRQLNKITNAKNGLELRLSAAQLRHLEKIGGILPLLALLPAILGAAGGLAGSIANVVNSSKQAAEQVRHNKATEELLKTKSAAEPLLEKVGLGLDALNKCN